MGSDREKLPCERLRSDKPADREVAESSTDLSCQGEAPEQLGSASLMPEGTQDVHFVRSEELLKGQRELVIIHGDKAYRLLRTRNDKLILQK